MGSASGATYTNHVRTSENVPFVVKRDFPRCRSQESLRGASTVPGAGPAAYTYGWVGFRCHGLGLLTRSVSPNSWQVMAGSNFRRGSLTGEREADACLLSETSQKKIRFALCYSPI